MGYSRALGGWGMGKSDEAATYSSAARAVPSARGSLTAVFGMGTGVTSPLWPPHQKSGYKWATRVAKRR